MKTLSPLALCFAATLVTGCASTLKSDYHAPAVNYPANWNKDDVAGDLAPFNWQAFNDPQHDSWLHRVMASNNQVAIAVLKVYKAQLEEQRIGILSEPRLSGALSVGSDKALDQGSGWTKTNSARLSTQYELDLWGKIARQQDAAVWAREATEQDLRTARLTVLSDASQNYWLIGYLNQRIASTQQSISYAKMTLRLTEARYRAGDIAFLDSVNAQQNLLTQESQLTLLQHERRLALNHQAELLGTAPGSPVVEPTMLPQGTLPQVNANVPATTLRHRPDVSAQEWRVRQALANVDIERAKFYPALSLTGSLGTSSSSLLAFLQNPVGSLGANLTLPFLEWRQRGTEVKIARNDYEQRVLDFKQSLYKAMRSIEDALSFHNQLLIQEKMLRQGLELAKKSERLNEVRYRQGENPVSLWLDAQEKRRQAELSLDENRFNQFKNLAKIYLEFGGSATFP